MKSLRPSLGWIGLALASALALAWAYPRAFPRLLPHWQVDRAAAEAIARANVSKLGELPVDAFVVTRLDSDPLLDFRLMLEPGSHERATAAGSWLAKSSVAWEVTIYAPGRRVQDWSYFARIAGDGELLDLRLRLPREEAAPALTSEDALARAREFLAEQKVDLSRYEEPEVKTQDLLARTDTTVRFREKEQLFGERLKYGVQVEFAGDRLAGAARWYEDPARQAIDTLLQPFLLISNFRFFMIFLLLPTIGVFFVRKYHEGVIGVDRALQVFLVALISGVVMIPMIARAASQGWGFGVLTREQTTLMWGVQMLLLYFVPSALVSALSWSVGESLCRERWGRKLAAFDALFRRDLKNRTVARSALRGLSLGLALAALLLLPVFVTPEWMGRPSASLSLSFWSVESAALPSLALVLFVLGFTLFTELFGRLFLVPALVSKLGVWGGGLAATLVAGMVFWGPLAMMPMSASFPVSLFFAGFLVASFLRWDFLTSTLASFTAQIVLCVMPYLTAESPRLELHGWLAMLVAALPCLLSLRWLGSEREFVYKYDEIPPHVRRIAERERQRVELETARNIQSSILPELPPSLHGVELAHTYLPATEVGGDFYDVLALDDGRLALAVGDVAGHGVSSGLVMSMAKSALAVQVSFDPEVRAVFGTLNRMVYQSARKRLLATLCYAVLDPRRRELHFASAGHLFPYRISAGGTVESLVSIAYPLGVRPILEVDPHTAKLEAGDAIFLCSDGLVEARREGSEEHFGFERVERVLSRAAGNGATVIRDAVLSELRDFVGDSPREDDLTLLVLRLPAA